MPRTKHAIVGLSCVVGACLVACGGNEPPPKTGATEEAAPVPRPAASKPKLHMSQELGEVDQKRAEDAVQRARATVLGCMNSGVKRVEFLSGDVKFFVRLTEAGSVRWAYLEETNLGDRETEKCILQALRGAPWPKPEGGEGEIRNSYSFGATDAREPAAWNADKIAAALGKGKPDLDKCIGRQRQLPCH